MPISEQALLTQLDKLKVEDVQTSLKSLKIKSPELSDADASTVLLHFLASKKKTSKKLSLIKQLFCLHEESENDLFQIMSWILKSHWSKLEFDDRDEGNPPVLTSYIKSKVNDEIVVSLCHLALYLARHRTVSVPVLEMLLHTAFGHSIDITRRREAIKYIQQLDFTPYAHLIHRNFLGFFRTYELLLGTPIENLFAAINNWIELSEHRYSFFMILCDKILDEDIFYSVDEDKQTLSFTHQNKNQTYEIKSKDTFLRLSSYRHDRLFLQSKFRPVLPAECLKIIDETFYHRKEEQFIQCMDMLKTLSNDNLNLLAARLHEINDLQKMIKKELRSREVSNPQTELKNQFKYFVFLEKYHQQHPGRSIKSKDIQRELGNDFAENQFPLHLQQIIQDVLEYENTRDKIHSQFRFKWFKTTTSIENRDDEKTESISIENHIERMKVLGNKIVNALTALSVDDLLTINNRLIVYPEIRKALKKICLIKSMVLDTIDFKGENSRYHRH
ncbi:MAG: hypothetical protein EPN84_10485 [Legionella sp.]|nr:MAG: hypothetical protein EPN84_10485 [Legionella sp.]